MPIELGKTSQNEADSGNASRSRQRKEDLSSRKCEVGKDRSGNTLYDFGQSRHGVAEKRSDLECGRETGVWRITISCRPSLLSCKFMALRKFCGAVRQIDDLVSYPRGLWPDCRNCQPVRIEFKGLG